MTKIKFILDPIPDTNLYLITSIEDGKISEVMVNTSEYLIKIWGNKHTNADVIVNALNKHWEIELYE